MMARLICSFRSNLPDILMPEIALVTEPNLRDPLDQTTANARSRPKPGERRVQILEVLATLLEQPRAERVTTASLAARLGVSEAALYRHFASKAQMFDGLIDFVEQAVMTLVNQIMAKETDAATQARMIVSMVVQFAEKNRGLTRVMVGDALVFEHDRLQIRMNLFFDKLEAAIKQCLRDAAAGSGSFAGTFDPQAQASVVSAFILGRLQRFTRSDFKRLPSEHLQASLKCLLG